MSLPGRARDQYAVVIILIMAVLALAPYQTAHLRPFIVLLLSMIFVFSLWTSGSPMMLVVVCAAISVVATIISGGSEFTSGSAPRFIFSTISMVLCAGTITAIVLRLASHARVTRQTVGGALAIYLMIGLLFAFVYAVVDILEPTGFFAQPGPHNAVSYFYFSYITLTTIGYGDLTAGTDTGRMLAVIEALLGQLYLVTVVALLVGNIGRERARPPRKQQP